MDPTLASLLGALFGGGITFLLNKQSHSYQLAALREQFKTDFMAEETVRHFLNHKSYTDRSFETLQKHLGGFPDDELRKILVRAGAIRIYRDDGSEWWRLLSRMDEYIENKSS
jgi:glutamate mutase epsilon subunit